MKLKVCGMRDKMNVLDLIEIKPEYIGFIFYPKSKRFVGETFEKNIPESIPAYIQKIGVFVNETLEIVKQKAKFYGLDFIQLHGDESAEYVENIKKEGLKVIKAFGISENFDFKVLDLYKNHCNYFLFDYKSDDYGGVGKKFNWEYLFQYKGNVPFFLSGGIDLDSLESLSILNDLPIYALDINSKFEIEPGLKNIEKIKEFKIALKR
jgi:phosphoribosylanthranilate isomerase